MDFKKYPSIENHYRNNYLEKWIENNPLLKDEKFIISEKIHGANFQIMITGNKISYASRNRVLKEGDSFYNYKDVMSKYNDMIKGIQKWGVVNSVDSIRLFGELFGSNIQKGVDYGSDIKFKVFDIYFNDKCLSPSESLDFLRLLGYQKYYVPIIGYAEGLDSALEWDTKFNTQLHDTKSSNIVEGVIIKPYNKTYSYKESVFSIKKKNECFVERQKSKKPKKTNSELEKVQEIYLEYVTENRLQNIFSKEGVIEEPSQIGSYIASMLNDAKEDFIKDNFEIYNDLPNKYKGRVFGVTGNKTFPMLKEYL